MVKLITGISATSKKGGTFFKNKYVSSTLILILVLLIDLLTKLFIRIYKPDFSLGFLKIVFVKNTGSAFGFFQDKTIVLTFISLIFLVIFLMFYNKIMEEKYYLAYFLILSGAIGNLIDRIFLGFVTDMISIGNFPVFNVADSAITIGAVFLIYEVIKIEIENIKKKGKK